MFITLPNRNRVWTKTFDGWISGRWRLRRRQGIRILWWVYRDGSRYSATGKFTDSVSFSCLRDAKRYVSKVE